MEFSTAEEVTKNTDFTSKVAIVTGANTGIGKETARVLALRNCTVILACRSMEKSTLTKKDICNSIGQDKEHLLITMELELSCFKSINKFAQEFKNKNIPLHYLINNAGVMCFEKILTPSGFESHFGINHLGHFLLTQLLLPVLRASNQKSKNDPGMVVVVSSEAHRYAPADLDLDDYNFDKSDFDSQTAYGISKFYNILFSFELNRRLEDERKEGKSYVVSNCLHPGVILTDLARENRDFAKMFIENQKLPVKTIAQGAATTLYAIVAPEAKLGGLYFSDCKSTQPRKACFSLKTQNHLWNISERLVKQSKL